MKRTRTILLLHSGRKIRLAFACCVRCHRLVGTCTDAHGPLLWDGIGFNQAGQLRFTYHICRPERRRDLARDAKLEVDRGTHGNRRDT
jgi:cytochrome c2